MNAGLQQLLHRDFDCQLASLWNRKLAGHAIAGSGESIRFAGSLPAVNLARQTFIWRAINLTKNVV
jgi:hypothetical protein